MYKIRVRDKIEVQHISLNITQNDLHGNKFSFISLFNKLIFKQTIFKCSRRLARIGLIDSHNLQS